MKTLGLRAATPWCCLAALLALCLVSSTALADNIINVYDATETITASVNGSPVTLNFNGPEEVWFTFDRGMPAVDLSWYLDLTDPGTGQISDRLGVFYDNSSIVTVRFCSDPSTFIFCAGNAPNLWTGPENGTLQWILTVTFGSQPFSDKYYVQSDVEPVPEPTSLILFGSGLVGLAGTLRRKLHT